MSINFIPSENPRIIHCMNDAPLTYRYAMWKGTEHRELIVSSDGEVYYSDNGRHAPTRDISGITYLDFGIADGYVTRIDYIVAYTYLGMFDDIVRIQHINLINNDNRASNIMWIRKSTILAKYIDLGILEPDGSIRERWAPCITQYNPTLGYEVSTCGNVRKADGTPVNVINQHGYKVFFYLDEHSKTTRCKMVHVAVAEAFIPNEHPDLWNIVNHVDGNKGNCMAYNLEWTDISGNSDHAIFQGLRKFHSTKNNAVHEVCRLLEEGKLPHVKIAEITGVNVKTVSDIYRGTRHTDISKNYKFANRKWSNSVKKEIEDYIRRGFKGKQIASMIAVEYDQPFISLYERTRRTLKANGVDIN